MSLLTYAALYDAEQIGKMIRTEFSKPFCLVRQLKFRFAISNCVSRYVVWERYTNSHFAHSMAGRLSHGWVVPETSGLVCDLRRGVLEQNLMMAAYFLEVMGGNLRENVRSLVVKSNLPKENPARHSPSRVIVAWFRCCYMLCDMEGKSLLCWGFARREVFGVAER